MSTKLVIIASNFEAVYPSVCPDVMWVSGQRGYLDMVSLGKGAPVVYWLSHCSRRCPINTKFINWTKILHRNVGGVTEARGTFGIDSRSTTLQLEKDLPRSISHVVKYSIRPTPCDPGTTLAHYDLSDRLSLSFPRRPVLYPTFMSRTGWGLRSLSDMELSSCFELPGYVVWEDRYLRDIVPLQMFRSVIESVCADLSPTCRSSPKRGRLLTADALPQPDGIWLDAVGKWLSGSWTDSSISDKAVKSDDAPIDFRPWNRRIQLIFPSCNLCTIGVMERFATRMWRSNLSRSLFVYARAHFGDSWLHDLHAPDLFATSRKRVASSGNVMSSRRSTGGWGIMESWSRICVAVYVFWVSCCALRGGTGHRARPLFSGDGTVGSRNKRPGMECEFSSKLLCRGLGEVRNLLVSIPPHDSWYPPRCRR